MALIDLISPEVVKIPLSGQNKPDIIRELLSVLDAAGKVADSETAYDALLAREAMGSTGLESGIAVPHAKTDAVGDLTIAIGIAPGGVDFDSIDGKPSRLFFLMLAPPDKSGPHIEALAEIARITTSHAFCRLLIAATSAEEVVALFQEE
jgi:fructose-specific phosphotransferase system IIA component